LLRWTFAGAVLLGLLGNPARAEPLRCSDEHRACVAACQKLGDSRAIRVCVTACTRQRNSCQRTGCWNNGARTYCGLSRR
jgi:hypothetical protein